MIGETGKIQYHEGFYGAIKAQYEPTRIEFTFLQELELGNEPIRMDMLVIKHNVGDTLGDAIGRFFKTHNVIEYKSPEDSLSVDDFYKAQGYALIYKGLDRKVNEIPIGEMTVSIFRHAYPRKMFETLEEDGLQIEEKYPGVYYVTGASSVQTQVVVTSRLAEGSYPVFKVLAKGFTREDVEKLLMTVQEMDDPNYADYIKAVLNVSIAIDQPIFEIIKKEGSVMGEAVERLFREEIEQTEARGRLAQAKETALNLYDMGMNIDLIARAVNVNLDLIKQWLGTATA